MKTASEKRPQSELKPVDSLLLFIKAMVTFLALIFGLIFWFIYSNNLSKTLEKIATINPEVDLVESGIRNLNEADNNFRLFIATGDNNLLNKYKSNLSNIGTVIDSLQSKNNNEKEIPSIKGDITRKSHISDNLFRIKTLTDSLIGLTPNLNKIDLTGKPDVHHFDKNEFIRRHQSITSDSVAIQQNKGEKKSFLKKVKGLFVNENETITTQTIKKRSQAINDSLIQVDTDNLAVISLLEDVHKFYRNQIEAIAISRKVMDEKESEMVQVNSSLIRNLDNLFKKVRQEEIENAGQQKKDLLTKGMKSRRNLTIVAFIVFVTALIILFFVITYLRKLDRYTRELHVAREKSEQMAAQKSNFLSSMSHEIRSPLSNIIGLAEQLNKEDLKDYQKKSLEGITHSSEILLATVNQILDYSVLEAGKLNFTSRNFNPFEIIGQVIEMMALRVEKKKLSVNYLRHGNTATLVSGDDFRLKQVVMNILDNAVKYSDKGQITVDAGLENAGDKLVFQLHISDQGIGIPQDQLQNIFVEFIRLEEKGKRPWQTGTGLGLAICKKLIDLQNGHIEAKSQEGIGTTFSIVIPYDHPAEDKEKHEVQASADFSSLSGKRILIAEDDEFSLLLITKILDEYNILTVSASSGHQAYELLMNEDFDCLLTDINMPEMDGFELVDKIRKISDPQKSMIPIIATTANVMEKDLKQIIISGMNGYILKPYREKELIEAVASICS
jgi:signal transduction histidine kinase